MKSTILAILALGLVTSISGVVFKILHFAGGSGVLVGGLFLTLLASALLVLQVAGPAPQDT